MYRREITVTHPAGLHARPAARFINLAKLYDSRIFIQNISDGTNNTANAKSIISVLALAVHKGCRVEISAEGPDEREAVDALAALIEDGFEESDAT